MTPTRRDAARWLVFGTAVAACGPAAAQAGHPADDYRLASQLFSAGRRDEATYWFYRGQYRFRVHLLARPGGPASGDNALFASLSETVGRPINEWAFGDVPKAVAILDRVIATVSSEDDAFTPKAQFPAAHAQILAGLRTFRNQMVARRGEIRRERQRNGLPNAD